MVINDLGWVNRLMALGGDQGNHQDESLDVAYCIGQNMAKPQWFGDQVEI